jgi:hypothetical protein
MANTLRTRRVATFESQDVASMLPGEMISHLVRRRPALLTYKKQAMVGHECHGLHHHSLARDRLTTRC